MARLDKLIPVKEVAQIGAAIGREFSYRLMAALSPMGEAHLRAAPGQASCLAVGLPSGHRAGGVTSLSTRSCGMLPTTPCSKRDRQASRSRSPRPAHHTGRPPTCGQAAGASLYARGNARTGHCLLASGRTAGAHVLGSSRMLEHLARGWHTSATYRISRNVTRTSWTSKQPWHRPCGVERLRQRSGLQREQMH